MAFLDSETGFELDATTLVLDREPRDLNRYNRSGPARVSGAAITGHPITVAYHQEADDKIRSYALEKLTDAQTAVLRTLCDEPGPITAKTTAGVSTTYTVVVRAIQIDPIIGHHTDGAPERIRYHRAEIEFSIEQENA